MLFGTILIVAAAFALFLGAKNLVDNLKSMLAKPKQAKAA